MSARLLTVNEAAARLAISRSHLYVLMDAGELQTVRLGKSRRIPESVIDDYVARLLASAMTA